MAKEGIIDMDSFKSKTDFLIDSFHTKELFFSRPIKGATIHP
jgi:hypothetical protein